MSQPERCEPVLNFLYRQYLDDEDSAAFIAAVSQRYTIVTLERLAERGRRVPRRAAVLALGFLANYDSNAVLGRALCDQDRGVRLLAENGIRDIWCRAGNEWQEARLKHVMRLIQGNQFSRAAQLATELINQAPHFAETWNQRAIAYYHLGSFEDSANDCHQTLELNPYHFAAAIGMGHCYLEMHDITAAIDCFRRSLRLNPDLEGVRAQIDFLQRSMEEHEEHE